MALRSAQAGEPVEQAASAKAPTPKPALAAQASVGQGDIERRSRSPSAPATPATGDWRIQLGAFAQRGSAEALYQRVSGKAALAGRSPYYIASGAVTRLQVGPFASKAAAAAACGAIGVPCFPVPAN